MSERVGGRGTAADDKKCEERSNISKLTSKQDIDSVKERLRNDGLQTLSKLLQESRAENKILKDKNNQLERAVDALSSKRQKTGSVGAPSGSTGDSRTTSNQYDDDISLPASSRNLVENLIRENNRLKQHLHNPQKVDEISMRACSLQSLNNSLKQEKGRLEQELAEVRSIIHRADNEKDKQILQLRDELTTCTQDYQRECNHRRTLEDQINKLNDELTDTAQKCLNMRKQLPTSANANHSQVSEKAGSSLPPPTESSAAFSGTPQETSDSSIRDKNARLESRCTQLEQQIQSLQRSSAVAKGAEQLAAENKMLREKLAEREEEIKQLREQCSLLKHQLDVYMEDFNKERTDRELTHEKYSKMEETYRNLAVQVPAKLVSGNNAWDGRQQAAARSKPAPSTVRFTNQASKPSSKDASRKPATASRPSLNKLTASSAPEADNISLSSQTEIRRPTKQKNDLACYKCDKRFGVDRHSELIDHLDVCTGRPK